MKRKNGNVKKIFQEPLKQENPHILFSAAVTADSGNPPVNANEGVLGMFGNPKLNNAQKGRKVMNMTKKKLTSAKEAKANKQTLQTTRAVNNGDGTCTLTIRAKDWHSMIKHLMQEGAIGMGLPSPFCPMECNISIHMDNCDMENYGLLTVEMDTYTMCWFMVFYNSRKAEQVAVHEAIWRDIGNDPEIQDLMEKEVA